VFQQIDQNKDDGTWQWTIRHISETEDVVGAEDPSTDTSGFIIEYGDPKDFVRYVGHYTAQTITPGSLSLMGYYEDVPANTFGTHAALKDRRKVTPFIKNEKVIDGKFNYDLFERVQTPQINDDDGWYYHGATESLLREKETLARETVYYDGKKLPGLGSDDTLFVEIFKNTAGGTIAGADTDGDDIIQLDEIQANAAGGNQMGTAPILARLQLASKRRRTVERWRKYFARKPTDSDLSGSMDTGTTTIKAAWDAVRNEQTSGTPPDAAEATTFDVVTTQFGWAIEKLVVRIDDQVYRDGDAFDHFFDSTGAAMTGVSALVVHASTGLKTVSTDETEA
jgi:hypothetical protein